MNVKTKMMIVGAVFTTGALGTVTAFAATSGSVSNATSSTVSSQTNSPSAHRGVGKDGFGHGGFGPGGGVGFAGAGSLSSLATTLGIDQQTLQSDLKAGQSLAQIAQGKGMSEQTLISDLEASYKQRLDAAVSSGKLTSTQEQKMQTNFNNNATKMVESTSRFWGNHKAKSGQTTNRSTSSTTTITGN